VEDRQGVWGGEKILPRGVSTLSFVPFAVFGGTTKRDKKNVTDFKKILMIGVRPLVFTPFAKVG